MPPLYSRTPPPTWGPDARSGLARTYGTRFQVTGDTTCVAISWYRASTSWNKPQGLMLYANIGTVLIDITAGGVPDSTGVGWKALTLVTPIALEAGVTYTAAVYFGASTEEPAVVAAVNRGPAGAGFIFDDAGVYTATGRTFPVTADFGSAYGVDITSGAAPEPVPPGPDDPASNASLEQWLSNDPAVQTHETDGLPWLTKVATDVLKTGQDTAAIVSGHIEDIVENIPKRSDSEWVKLNKLLNLWLELSDLEYELLMDFLRRGPHQLTGDTPGGGSAFFGPSGGQVAERAEVAATNTELLWHRTQTSNWLDAVPGGDWALQDTLTWTGPTAWPQPADCYVLNITSWPATWDRQDIADRIWLPRAAWWSPMTDTIPAERRFAEFDTQLLHALPLRCAGIMFVPQSGFEGTLEAWLRPDMGEGAGIPVPPVP